MGPNQVGDRLPSQDPRPHAGVDLIEDVDLATRVFRRGTRGIGAKCRLLLSLNGQECLEFHEEAGDRAPADLVIDIRMPAQQGERLMAALAVRPWIHSEQPVIVFPCDGGAAVGYLVRSAVVHRVLETIAMELDLSDLIVEEQSALDPAATRG